MEDNAEMFNGPVLEVLHITFDRVCVCVCVCVCARARVRSVASNPMDCSLPGSSVHGILQAK